MRDYGVVHCTYWTSATSHDFSDDAKLLGAYLMTGPHSTALGCYRLPDGYVTADLKWSIERVTKGFEELSRKGWAYRCETTQWVLIRNYLKFNPPDNPNQVKSLRRLASQVPDNATIIEKLREALTLHCGRFEQGELFDEKRNPQQTLPQTVTKPFRNQNQNQNQNQKQEKNTCTEPKSSVPPAPANGKIPTAIYLTLNTGQEFPITVQQANEWQQLYPAVDVPQQLRAMRAWLGANPKNRKTQSGILRFANLWLSKEQNRGGTRAASPTPQRGATRDAAPIIEQRRKARAANREEK